MKNNLTWAFFGTDEFSTMVLDELKSQGFIPNLIVTTEDKPKGRKLLLTPPEAKVWADKENVNCLQLKTLRNEDSFNAIKSSVNEDFDLFVVASYGKIIPQNILDIPKYKTLNIHPSLLPKLRGPSPIASSILSENETGVTV
jgi:methionyl-tRNA formyltransferase